MSIKTKKDFIKQLDKYLKNDKIKQEFYLTNDFYGIAKTEELIIIDNYDFSGLDLKNLDFQGFSFINCKFDNCDFLREITFRACIFDNCSFNNSFLHDFNFFECDLLNITFRNSKLTYFKFGDSLISDTKFESCPEILEFYFGGCEFKNLIFKDVYLAHTRFVGHTLRKCEFKLAFLNSLLDNNQFLHFDLTDSVFRKCILSQTTFSNCLISNNSIDKSNSSKGNEFSFIDFQSIIQSESIEPIVLENCFGINESIIKEKITEVATKIEYQTIFISYSFKDKAFASNLNDALKRKGISTFLWEKDAPGGKGLKKIMKESVKKQDRLLFIASENSVKSKACHFELSEGRMKQEILWQDILFPIHIDNFLFEIGKDDIRPIDSQDEYWSNIKELREINSIDFSNVKDKVGELEFEKKIMELIKGLKK
jgi:uncharacterized protein YjbI with pentapeptide repeats